MNKLFLLFILFLSSCHIRQHRNEHYMMNALNQSLDNSTTLISEATEKMYRKFESAIPDSSDSAMNNEWFLKADKIKRQTTNFINYVENLKFELKEKAGLDISPGNISGEDDEKATKAIFKERDKAGELRQSVKHYKEEMIEIDEEFETDSKKTIETMIEPLDPEWSGDDYWEDLFKDKSPLFALVVLSRFQNSARIIENKSIKYCYERYHY